MGRGGKRSGAGRKPSYAEHELPKQCVFCGSEKSVVIRKRVDSFSQVQVIRRRRRCKRCKEIWGSTERCDQKV